MIKPLLLMLSLFAMQADGAIAQKWCIDAGTRIQIDCQTPSKVFGKIIVNGKEYFRPILSKATHHSDGTWSYEFECPNETVPVIGADKPNSNSAPYCK